MIIYVLLSFCYMGFYFNIYRTNYVYYFKDTNCVSVTTGVNIGVGRGGSGGGEGTQPSSPLSDDYEHEI